MSTPKIELQRCVCGGEAERVGFHVRCKKCGLRTKEWNRIGDAVKDWNRIMSGAKPAPVPAKPAKKPAKKRPERQHHGGRR